MTELPRTDPDLVTHVIKYCNKDHKLAESLFSAVATRRERTLTLPDGPVTLNEEEAGEFVQRYSSEVEPAIWVSKRRKE